MKNASLKHHITILYLTTNTIGQKTLIDVVDSRSRSINSTQVKYIKNYK
jgi:hypothetical protein